jgi:hypothetical protein
MCVCVCACVCVRECLCVCLCFFVASCSMPAASHVEQETFSSRVAGMALGDLIFRFCKNTYVAL